MEGIIYPIFQKYFFLDVKRIHICPGAFSPDLNTLSHPEREILYAQGEEVNTLESVLLMESDISVKKPLIDSAVVVFVEPYWNYLSDAFIGRISASVIMDLSLMVSVHYRDISKLYSQQMPTAFHQTFRKILDDLQNKKKSKINREKAKQKSQQEPPSKVQKASGNDVRNNGQNTVPSTHQIISQTNEQSEAMYMYPVEVVKLENISMQNKQYEI